MEHEKRGKRTLEDVSHFFLSSLEKSPGPRKEEVRIPPLILAVLDPEEDCSLPRVVSLAEKLDLLSQEAVLLDFHPKSRCENGDRETGGAGRCEPVVINPWENFSDKIFSRETKFVFLDIPWEVPSVRNALLGHLSGMLVFLKPTLLSLKAAYRLLKMSSGLFRGKVFALWREECSTAPMPVAFAWMDLVKQYLGKDVEWLDAADSLLARLGPQGLKVFDFEFLRRKDPDAQSAAFFENGRLDLTEIGAFSSLACREGVNSVLFRESSRQ